MSIVTEIRRSRIADANLIAENLTNAVEANLRYRRAMRTNDRHLATAIIRIARHRNWTLKETTP